MSILWNKFLIVLFSGLIILLSLALALLLWYDWANNQSQTTAPTHRLATPQSNNSPTTQIMPSSEAMTITPDSANSVMSRSFITPTTSSTASPTPTSSTLPVSPIPFTTTSTPTNILPPAPTAPTRIIASAIGLNSSVTEMGWEVKENAEGRPASEWVVPEFAAGWHINSMLPGHGGNTVLSGHHNIGAEVFRDLIHLEAGDHVAIEAGNIRYDYSVEEKYIVKEEGVSEEIRQANYRYIEPTTDERLTLVSCWPYESNSHRVIIIARPVWE